MFVTSSVHVTVLTLWMLPVPLLEVCSLCIRWSVVLLHQFQVMKFCLLKYPVCQFTSILHWANCSTVNYIGSFALRVFLLFCFSRHSKVNFVAV